MAASRRTIALLAINGLLLTAIGGLGGYVLGERAATAEFIAANPDSPTAIEAGVAKAKAGGNGTRGPGPVAKADGTYDALIFGSSGAIQSQEDLPKVHRRNEADPFAIGPTDAPVVIAEFSDFECPFCARYTTQTEDALIKDYVDRGLLRIEWNDMPINGPKALAGAKAGRAAAEQGKFYEFKHALYQEAATKNGHPEFGIADYERFAAAAGVPDLAKFTADATSTKYDAVLQQAQQYGGSLGVNGTPGFLIGTKFVSGAQPTDVFKKTIDQQLAQSARG
ncbi:DsbA family protein [Corynebacterium epidermidicanis]|uniref:Protein-disulfide isomerase n=1 Tax=Corynebacterium epidermidicanis TaxID=1050174 RepID=A0A0G3GZ08_9CORY|nr:thioredoxin domain-containing protein [Corynebacterium epidermidicanis]AKK04087.1 protein-disulfide isomerase [Corynebacterium epidermidicanis]